MPFIAPLIGAAVGGFLATAAGQAVLNIGLSIAASYLAKRLMPQPNNGQGGTTLSLRMQSNESREIAFGRVASAGSLKYHHTYGPNRNDFVQLVYQLADHECDALEHVYVDGREVLFDETSGEALPPANPNDPYVTPGQESPINYAGRMWMRFYSGAWDQAADSELTAENEAWTSDFRGRGICYVVMTLKYHQETFKTGLPPFLFVFRGAKLYDWRLDSTNGGSGSHRWDDESTREWSNNSAVCLYNYRRGINVNGERLGGMSTPVDAMPVEHWSAAANACDEEVAINEPSGSSELRYTCNGIVPVQSEHATVVREMLATMAGVEVDSGGSYVLLPGVARSPVMTIEDTDLMAPEMAEVIPKLSRSVLVNGVFGTFRDPSQLYAEVALPPRLSPEDEATDGAPLHENYALQFVTSGTQGQRVLEIIRRKGRYQRRFKGRLRSRFAVLESGDWVTWTSERYGWVSLDWEVLQVTLNRDLTVDVELREINTDIYSWDEGFDELNPLNPLPVSEGGSDLTTVAGIALTPVVVDVGGGIERPGLTVTWTAIDDLTVVDLQLEYRRVGDTVALSDTIFDPTAGTYTWVNGVQGGAEYEVRLRPVTLPPRPVVWSAWIDHDDVTDPQVVNTALIAEAVPPDTITAAMLAAQERFELSLVTQTNAVLAEGAPVGGLYLYGGDSVATRVASIHARAEQAAEAALSGLVDAAGNKSIIRELQTTTLSETEALASLITILQVELDGAEASITSEQSARITADGVLASSIESVETTVDGHTATISVISASVDGLSAQWGVEIDIDGNVVGLVRLDGDDTESTFTVVADVFQVAQPDDPDGDPVEVFTIAEVDGVAKVALRGDMLIDGSILARHIDVSTLSAITADIGEVTAGIIRSSDNKFVIDLDNKTLTITT